MQMTFSSNLEDCRKNMSVITEWDNYSHFTGELNDNCANVGEKARVLTGDWGQHKTT